MAKVNLTQPKWDMSNLNDSQVIRKIASYLYIQNEQLRYELTHLDEDNMSPETGNTVQGITQAQLQKAIQEATQNQNIDLSSNTIIVNLNNKLNSLERNLDSLSRQQGQDANNITRIIQELGRKVSVTTYNSGISGLNSLISGNTTLINNLNSSYQQHLTDYNSHKHSMYISSGGVISMGGPTASPANPNIADTEFYKNAVAAARSAGETEAKREWRPDRIRQDGNHVTILNAAGDDIAGPYGIEGYHPTERANAVYGVSAGEYLAAGTEVDQSGYYYFRSSNMARTTLYE